MGTDERPTEFRGCMWDDGWEFDAPCVVYYPPQYARFGIGGNNGAIDSLVEDICYDIEEGIPHVDGGLDRECKWRGWGRHGFARRKRAEHVVITVEWGDDGWAEIVSRAETLGPPPRAAGVKAVKAAIAALCLLLAFAAPVEAMTTPRAWPECLQRDVLEDLRNAQAEPWELDAVRVITRDGRSKGEVDLIVYEDGCRMDVAWAHFPVARLGLGPQEASWCPAWEPPNFRWLVLSVLYSEAAPSLLLEVWRRNHWALDDVREKGWRRRHLALAAAVVNTSPTLFRRLLSECSGEPNCVADRYAEGSAHRERRVQAWRELR